MLRTSFTLKLPVRIHSPLTEVRCGKMRTHVHTILYIKKKNIHMNANLHLKKLVQRK